MQVPDSGGAQDRLTRACRWTVSAVTLGAGPRLSQPSWLPEHVHMGICAASAEAIRSRNKGESPCHPKSFAAP